MKELTLKSEVHIYSYKELSEADRQLIHDAKEATNRSYVPYSHFHVGAAARLMDGTIVTGNNQENAAYPSGLCAERTTLFYANAQNVIRKHQMELNAQYPDQPVETLAIAARTEKDFIDSPIPPCGACRQVMLETEQRFNRPMRIMLYGKKEIYVMEGVGTLLLLSFGAEAME